MTMHLNQRLNSYAKKLSDGKLLAKLSGGDAIAQELKYHIVCLAELYNRESSYLRSIQSHEQARTMEPDAYPLAF